jgi:CSLREA domain-containing protein
MRPALQKSLYVFMCLSLMIILVGVQPAYAASFTVTKTADTNDGTCDADCSLREAVTAANNNGGTHTITVPAGTYTLGSQLPQLTSTTITINGADATTTIIQANASPNVATYRIFELWVNASLTINGVTLQNGRCNGSCFTSQAGGIIYGGPVTITNSIISNGISQTGGGAISGASGLTIVNTTFSGNTASSQGGAVVMSGGTLSITNSTFINNSAQIGGAVATFGTNVIANSTFSGNTGSIFGGAVFNGVGGTLTAVNDTFSANTSPLGAGIYNNTGATLHLKNNILANSITGADCYNDSGDTIATNINNLIETNSPSGNKCGTPTLTADPSLGSLASNGGLTQTFALPLGSVALGAGDTTTCAAAPISGLDQRGSPRPAASCDLGAFESNQQAGPSLVVNSSDYTSDGFCDLYTAGLADCTLQEAIEFSNAQTDANTITFDPTYVNAANPISTIGVNPLPTITTQITITGNNATDTIIQAAVAAGTANRRIFLVSSTGNLTLNKLTLRYGRCNVGCAGSPGGGAILSQGTLTVNDSIFSDNYYVNYEGGSILNLGTLTVNNSSFLGNPAYASDSGGAIANGSALYGLSGTATISNSTFSGNYTNNSGAAIANMTSGSTLTLVNSSVFDNHSTGNRAGGIFVRGTVNIYNSTISGNVANISGDNIYINGGTLNLYNTIIANSTSHGDCILDTGTVSSTNSLIESTGTSACGLTNGTNGNIIGSDPNLGTLTGSPAYLPLNGGSPAIDAGDDATCAAAPVSNTSQNGVSRPSSTHCDIGSFEKVQVFADVPFDGFAWAQIESIYTAGITGGCSTNPLNYCPNNSVTRAQMAVFLLRGIHGSAYSPPTATGTVFTDVPSDAFAAAWIEQMVAEGITSGCGNGNYCPNSTVTRAQMAVFLLRAKYGAAYSPPVATGTVFTDVPSNGFAAAFIEQLVSEGITSGCGGGNYCPNSSITRAQMAVFLQRTFNLPLQ